MVVELGNMGEIGGITVSIRLELLFKNYFYCKLAKPLKNEFQAKNIVRKGSIFVVHKLIKVMRLSGLLKGFQKFRIMRFLIIEFT